MFGVNVNKPSTQDESSPTFLEDMENKKHMQKQLLNINKLMEQGCRDLGDDSKSAVVSPMMMRRTVIRHQNRELQKSIKKMAKKRSVLDQLNEGGSKSHESFLRGRSSLAVTTLKERNKIRRMSIERLEAFDEEEDDGQRDINLMRQTYKRGRRISIDGGLGAANDTPEAIDQMVNTLIESNRHLLESTQPLQELEDSLLDFFKDVRDAAFYLSTCVIMPSSDWKKKWDVFIILLVFYNTILLPITVAFYVDFGTKSFDNVVDAVFIFDIYLSFRTAHLDEWGNLEVSLKRIRRVYLRSWFICDFVASFPVELLVFAATSVSSLSEKDVSWMGSLKIYRLLRFGRVIKMLKNIKFANAFRIFRLFLGFALVAHLLGCVWYLVNRIEVEGYSGGRNLPWIDNVDGCMPTTAPTCFHEDLLTRYCKSVYAAMCMLFGEDIAPTTDIERIVALASALIGSVITAMIFGNVAAIVQALNANDARCREKMNSITDRMRFLQLHPLLQEKIRNYFEYMFITRGGMGSHSTFVYELSPPLQEEINWHLHQDVIFQLPFFKGLEDTPDFRASVQQITSRLVNRVYLPMDYVYHEGEVGYEAFIVSKGKVVILSHMDDMEYYVLRAGQIFGELALCEPTVASKRHRRETSARAETFCDMYVLTHNQVEEVAAIYPAFDTCWTNWLAERKIKILGKTIMLWVRDGKRRDPYETLRRFVREWRARRAAKTAIRKSVSRIRGRQREGSGQRPENPASPQRQKRNIDSPDADWDSSSYHESVVSQIQRPSGRKINVTGESVEAVMHTQHRLYDALFEEDGVNDRAAAVDDRLSRVENALSQMMASLNCKPPTRTFPGRKDTRKRRRRSSMQRVFGITPLTASTMQSIISDGKTGRGGPVVHLPQDDYAGKESGDLVTTVDASPNSPPGLSVPSSDDDDEEEYDTGGGSRPVRSVSWADLGSDDGDDRSSSTTPVLEDEVTVLASPAQTSTRAEVLLEYVRQEEET